jgi:hypothetical protein
LALSLSAATLIFVGPSAMAQPQATGHDAASACPVPLKGYRPVAAASYIAPALLGQIFGLDDVKEKANGDISGISDLDINGTHYFGTFTGSISSDTVKVQGKVENFLSFSFSGTASCLLSRITADNVVSNPSGYLPSTMKMGSDCQYVKLSRGGSAACAALQILDDTRQPLWDNGGKLPGNGLIPYLSGGGHAAKPGPTQGYNAEIKAHVTGMDCSAFARWAYYLAADGGHDPLSGPHPSSESNTRYQYHFLTVPVPAGLQLGDLVFFVAKNGVVGLNGHEGIYIGQGMMIDEPNSSSHLRIDPIKGFAPGQVTEYRRSKP